MLDGNLFNTHNTWLKINIGFDKMKESEQMINGPRKILFVY